MWSKGQYDRAIAFYEKALAIQTDLLGDDHPDVATSYIGLGGAFYSKGDYDQAIGYYEKALAIRRKVFGEQHPDVASSYLGLATAYFSKGEYDREIGYVEQALAIQMRLLGEEHPDVAHSYITLGGAYDAKGEPDRAIAYYEKALAIQLKALGEEHPDVAQDYLSLGDAYQAEGQPDRAIGYFEKALSIQKKALGEEHPLVATTDNDMGLAYASRGDYDQAITCYATALSILVNSQGARHPNVAGIYENLGAAYYYKGESDRAIGYDKNALQLAIGIADRERSIELARNLGWLYVQLGRFAEAKDAFQQGIAAIEQARDETGGGKVEYTARNISLYYLSLQASVAMHDVQGVFQAAEAMRARGFLDRLSLSAALSVTGVPTETRTKMLALNDEIESLASQRTAEIQKAESDQDKQALIEIANRLQQKEQEFAQLDQSLMSNASYKELRQPALASLKDAEQMVAGDEAILEYVLWEKDKEQQAYCLIVKSSGAELVELDRSFTYTQSVEDFRQAILQRSAERDTLGNLLYAKLIGALDGKLEGVRKLVIVPDGALAFLPFDALRQNISSPYLCEIYQVSLAPSVSVLQMVGARNYGAREGQWLAFGGASYSGIGAEAQRGARGIVVVNAPTAKTKEYCAGRGAQSYYKALGIQWDDLPGTRDEVLTIAQTVYGGKGTRVVLGAQASEQLVKQLSASGELAQQRVVHFACHGLYDAEYPSYSALVLSEVSGALKDSPESGYLTAEDVAVLRFKADFVNLSACETGLGKVVQGDGVVGLTRSFLVAGANRVGATLWVVDDAATKEFMVKLYSQVEKQGLGYSEAITAAKKEFIRSPDFSDPYYWSGFVLYGR